MSERLSSPLPCPYCAAPNDARVDTGVDVDVPGDGDLSLCWDCRRPSRFVVGPFGLAVQGLSPEEEAALASDPEFRRALGAALACSHPVDAARRLRGLGS